MGLKNLNIVRPSLLDLPIINHRTVEKNRATENNKINIPNNIKEPLVISVCDLIGYTIVFSTASSIIILYGLSFLY